MEDDLAELLGEQRMSCRLWPEQTEGPYRRDMHPERRDITEGRDGLPLRVGLRLLEAGTGNPLTGALVEVWQADHEGRYSGFRPFRARPGQIVTSASVPRDVVAPSETFLRGYQRTDDRGFCVFDTIYPGWYSSRTVHIHLTVQVGDHTAVTQLYFPDDLTDEVFARPPRRASTPGHDQRHRQHLRRRWRAHRAASRRRRGRPRDRRALPRRRAAPGVAGAIRAHRGERLRWRAPTDSALRSRRTRGRRGG